MHTSLRLVAVSAFSFGLLAPVVSLAKQSEMSEERSAPVPGLSIVTSTRASSLVAAPQTSISSGNPGRSAAAAMPAKLIEDESVASPGMLLASWVVVALIAIRRMSA